MNLICAIEKTRRQKMNLVIRFIWLTLIGFVINSDPDQDSDGVTNTRGILGPLESSNTETDGANSLYRVNSDQTRHVYNKHGEHDLDTLNRPPIHILYVLISAK